ncbi:MAG: hypothetical protein R3185_01320 [Candidatus Thermoplasmatota archaeon]|nr:hypothetical protein [Candidatus Thermoplasmatota archaeon]
MAGASRLDLATIRRRGQRYFYGAVTLQVVALILAGVLILRGYPGTLLLLALGVTPLAAAGFGLLTLYHFVQVDAQRRAR